MGLSTVLMEVSGVDTSGAKAAVESALTSVGSDMTGIITTILPIALGIVGAVMVIKFGVRFFKNISGGNQ